MRCLCFLLGLFLSLRALTAAPVINSSPLLGLNKTIGNDSGLVLSAESFNSRRNISIDKNNNSEDVDGNIDDYYADMMSIGDEASLEDEALVLAHVQMDINDFEDLKKTIAFLENHVSKHADVHVVKSHELVEADKMLKDLDVNVIKFYEQELLSLKSQIPKLNHKFNNQSIDEISLIVENAEMFLQLSMEKVQELEMLDQEWEVAEETAQIQEMIDLDERKEFGGKIIIEALKPSVSDKFKKKLSDQEDISKPASAYPTSKPAGLKINLEKSVTEASSSSMYKKMKQKKMLKNGDKKQASKPIQSDIRHEIDENSKDEDFVKDSSAEDEKRSQELHKIAELAKIAALRTVKENLEREAFSDLKGKDRFLDPVEHYSTGVKEALEVAKDISHEFIHLKLHNGAHEVQDGLKTSALSYLHILLIILALIVLVVTVVAFRTLTKRKRATIAFQNLSGVGSCDRSYMELESVKEDDSWGGSWSPWTAHKKKQHKFK